MNKSIVLVMLIFMTVAGNAVARDELTAKEKAAIMKEVKRDLKDPESAKFKWLKLSNDVDMKASDVAANYCGLLNSKNSYGGYVGFRPFSATLAWSKGKMSNLMTVTIYDDVDVAYEVCSKLGYADFALAE